MSQRTRTRQPPASRQGPSSPFGDVALGLLPILAVSFTTCRILALPTSHVLLAVAPYAALGSLLLAKLPSSHPGPGLGTGNRLTLARATLVLSFAAPALWPGVLTGEGYWWIVGLSTIALVLDGLDGPLARRTGTASAFGARFDMELDALLLMALSALLWRSGKTGSWVLLVGAVRYLFLLGGLLWPRLRGELPPSRRGKVICAVQGIVLVICLAPVTGPAPATTLAASALLLLVYSFVADTWWLARSAGSGS
jgi:phosphatidylglycerophosphate synthase